MFFNFFFKIKHMHTFTEFKVVLCHTHGRIHVSEIKHACLILCDYAAAVWQASWVTTNLSGDQKKKKKRNWLIEILAE